VVAAGLLQVNPFDQPGVEAVTETTQGWLGRPGSEAFPQQFAAARPLMEKYIIS
jgi:glucose-6-phosphate isomerase